MLKKRIEAIEKFCKQQAEFDEDMLSDLANLEKQVKEKSFIEKPFQETQRINTITLVVSGFSLGFAVAVCIILCILKIKGIV